jgi:hypothetical protein
MAEEMKFRSGSGKIRSFGAGLGLSIITFGIYFYFWYFSVNNELQRIGESYSDPELSASKPINSLMAVLFGGMILIPPYLSVYRYGKRLKRAEGLVGVREDDQINPTLAFLLLFPGGILIIPAFIYYWYVTKHQNQAVNGAAIGPMDVPVTNIALG